MIVIGAKAVARDLLEVFVKRNEDQGLVFFDDVSTDLPALLYDRYRIIRSLDELRIYFEGNERDFVLGVGTPKIRSYLAGKITELGGDLQSIYCPKSAIGSFGVTIERGVSIMTNAIVSNDVFIGKGCLVNYNAYVAHDCRIGEFTEVCPGVNILGRCTIGKHVFIGAGATILPDVEIGDYVVVAAGSVVREDVPSHVLVAGVPAVIKRNF